MFIGLSVHCPILLIMERKNFQKPLDFPYPMGYNRKHDRDTGNRELQNLDTGPERQDSAGDYQRPYPQGFRGEFWEYRAGGGNKSTQSRDIETAKQIAKNLEV
jgi:hypothetical protein